MGVLLGLVVAVTYGTGDFFGGLAARRVPVLWVVFLSHALAAVLVVAIVGLDHNSHPTREDIVIGIVAGIVGMVSVALFYRGLAIGRMGMVAPITAVVSAIVPVAWGLTFGERPSPEAVDSPHEPIPRSRAPLYLALGAGLGFGAFFVLYSNAGARSGMWPLLASRWTSATLLALVFAFVPRARRDPPSRNALPLIVGAVSSLYPASTVLLARGVLHERFHRAQIIGLTIAALGVVLIALG